MLIHSRSGDWQRGGITFTCRREIKYSDTLTTYPFDKYLGKVFGNRTEKSYGITTFSASLLSPLSSREDSTRWVLCSLAALLVTKNVTAVQCVPNFVPKFQKFPCKYEKRVTVCRALTFLSERCLFRSSRPSFTMVTSSTPHSGKSVEYGSKGEVNRSV